MKSSDGEPLSPLRGSADPLDLTGFILGNLDEKGNLDSDSILNKVDPKVKLELELFLLAGVFMLYRKSWVSCLI